MIHLPHIKGRNIESGHRYVELDLEPIMIAVAELNSCKLSSLMICCCLPYSVCAFLAGIVSLDGMNMYLLSFDPYETRLDWILRWQKDILVNIIKHFRDPVID